MVFFADLVVGRFGCVCEHILHIDSTRVAYILIYNGVLYEIVLPPPQSRYLRKLERSCAVQFGGPQQRARAILLLTVCKGAMTV